MRREQIVEMLTDLLRDPYYPVNFGAVFSLREMEAVEAIPALESYARSITFQDQITVEKIMAGMRDSDKSDGSAVKKQLEDLQEKVRKLEDRVETLSAQAAAADSENDEKP